MDPKNSDITYFGQTDFRGQKTRFGIKTNDRARHVYVIGKTGMGKSTLLENLAIQDIQTGKGMAFIDPHGRSAEMLLDFVPENRIKDVVYFAPFDLEHPISFNVMEDVGKDQRYFVANGLMSSFKKIWPDVWSSRMEYILNNTILALLEFPDSTLLGVNRMLSDTDYRKAVVENISDPSVRSFWVDEFAKYNERYMQEAGDAIKNKIGQFTASPLIRNIIGQSKSSFDMRQIMDDQKILIINLSKGRVGEQNANLIGGMLITKIYLAAMSRANLSEKEMKDTAPFYLHVDEFQSFVNDSFADILSEARKYKLNLTIAHQYVEQMPETVRNAVFGNVGTTIAFRVGPFDAELLEKIFSPKFTQEDLVNLGFAQIYLTLMIDGVGSPPFSATTLPPIVNTERSYQPEIIESSRQHFARSRVSVEADIVKWHEKKFGPSGSGTTDSGRAGGRAGFPRADGRSDRPDRSGPAVGGYRPGAGKNDLANKLKEALNFSIQREAIPVKNETVKVEPAVKTDNIPVEVAPVTETPKKPTVEESREALRNLLEKKVPVSDGSKPLPVSPVNKPISKTPAKFSLDILNNKRPANKGQTANKDELRSALKDLLTAPSQTIKAVDEQKPDQNPKEPDIPAKKEIPEDVLRQMLAVPPEEV